MAVSDQKMTPMRTASNQGIESPIGEHGMGVLRGYLGDGAGQ
jgi:hypothetical protein